MIIKRKPEEITAYLSDAANYSGDCSSVYFPESEDEIKSLLSELYSSGTPVTISGNRTGLTGAAVPEGGAVISLEKLNKILSFDETNKSVTVQPGVMLSDLQEEINRRGFYYPPDPTEQNCFIGGNIAANASGAKSFKYGPTRNYVNAIRLVLPDGDTISLRRGDIKAAGRKMKMVTGSCRVIGFTLPGYEMPGVKHAAGYYVKDNMDAVDLFVGSEGTLGVITEAELKLLDKPERILSGVIFFDNEDKSLGFIERARELSYANRKKNLQDNMDALGLEFFDKGALEFLREDYPAIPAGSAAAVWFEQEVNAGNEEKLMEEWFGLISEYGGDTENSWLATDPKDRAGFHNFRHAVSAKVNEYLSRNNLRKVGTDTAVPHKNFRDFFRYARGLAEKAGIKNISYGHFGDSHLHLNMLPRNEDEYKTAKKIYGDICRRAVELKGTISAEHGIGKLKRKYLEEMFGKENIRAMAGLKKVFDPKGLLNRGNIVGPEFL